MCVENGDHRPPLSSIPWTSSRFLRERKLLSWLSGERGTVCQTLLRDSSFVPLTKAETLFCVCVCSRWVCVCTWVWLKRRVAGKLVFE